MRNDPDLAAYLDELESDETFMKVMLLYESSRLSQLALPPEDREVDMELPGVVEAFTSILVDKVWDEAIRQELKPFMFPLNDAFARSYILARVVTDRDVLASAAAFSKAMQLASTLVMGLGLAVRMMDDERYKHLVEREEEVIPADYDPVHESDLEELIKEEEAFIEAEMRAEEAENEKEEAALAEEEERARIEEEKEMGTYVEPTPAEKAAKNKAREDAAGRAGGGEGVQKGEAKEEEEEEEADLYEGLTDEQMLNMSEADLKVWADGTKAERAQKKKEEAEETARIAAGGAAVTGDHGADADAGYEAEVEVEVEVEEQPEVERFPRAHEKVVALQAARSSKRRQYGERFTFLSSNPFS
jgi:hypothetical protein